jgi:8-oxo-dGTP diphosphatase
MDHERPPIAAAIIVNDHRVLLVRRRVSEGTLSWQFPAGALEPGETPDQAAVREAAEETGLTVEATAILGERTHPATGRQMHYIACKPLAGTAEITDPDELDAVAWCSKAELAVRIPTGLFEPVAAYLERTLNEPGEAPV